MKTAPILMIGWMFAAALTAAAAESNSPAGPVSTTHRDFVSFRLISDRNIFNPNRSRGSSNRVPPRTEPEKRVRFDRFALLGTMSYEKGRFAFFDGSSSEFRKVAKPEDSIAGFKVTEVAPTCVKLQLTNGQVLELCVGMQMKKIEDREWELAGKADPAEGTGPTSSAPSSSLSTSGSESEDVLKRLLEKRTQEGPPAEAPAPAEAARIEEVVPAALPAPGESDEVLKRLLQKREQEQNK